MEYGDANCCGTHYMRARVLYRTVSLVLCSTSLFIECFQQGANLLVTYYPYRRFYSLERVPETGRWRFIDVSPSFEASIAKDRHNELLSVYGARIEPPESPITQHVRRIVTKILEANELGYLSSVNHSESREEGNDDVWNWVDRVPGSGGREWNVLVVHDPDTINAMVSFGMDVPLQLDCLSSLHLVCRRYRNIHGSIPSMFRFHISCPPTPAPTQVLIATSKCP